MTDAHAEAQRPQSKTVELYDARCMVDDLSPLALAILDFIGSVHDDYGYYSFVSLTKNFRRERVEIKAAIDELRNYDLVDFQTGLVNDEGGFAGSGYARSERGEDLHCIYCAIRESVALFEMKASLSASAPLRENESGGVLRQDQDQRL